MRPGGILIGFSALTAGVGLVVFGISPSPLSALGGGDPPRFPGAAATEPPSAPFPLRHDH